MFVNFGKGWTLNKSLLHIENALWQQAISTVSELDMHRNDDSGKSEDCLYGFVTLKLSRRNFIGILSLNKVIRFRENSK